MCIIVSEPEIIHHENYDDLPGLIPIIHSPDGRDCTMSIHNFKTNESSFHALILCYSSVLNHRMNGVTLSSATLDYGVIETMRNGETVDIYYPTIQDWIRNYSGINNIRHILDTIFMGNNSLWDIM